MVHIFQMGRSIIKFAAIVRRGEKKEFKLNFIISKHIYYECAGRHKHQTRSKIDLYHIDLHVVRSVPSRLPLKEVDP